MVPTLSKYRSTMSRPQKVHTHLPGSDVTAGVEDEDEESDDGEKQSSSKMSSEPEEPCNKYQSDEAFRKAIQLQTTFVQC